MNVCIRLPNHHNIVTPDKPLIVERNGLTIEVYAGRLQPGDKIVVLDAVIAMGGDGK